MRLLCAFAFVAIAVPEASAWETKKFDARRIQKEWGLPAFAKGTVVGGEVTVNDEPRERSAEWALRKVDVKAAADFYQAKLKVEPAHKKTDSGDDVYTFRFPYNREKRIVRRVYVKLDGDDKLVHIRFAETRVPEGEDPPEDG